MNLSKTEQAVLEFLTEPRTALEVQAYLGHSTIPYNTLRLLQRLDLVDKISPYERAAAKFVQSGRPMRYEKPVSKEWHTVFGVRI
jgi:hypothetical protein